MKEITVKIMVECYLQDNFYDGLVSNEGVCSCDIDDLMPCFHINYDCMAGYKVKLEDGSFGISTEKGES